MSKLVHIADLHLGRKYENYDLLDDQKEVLKEIIEIIKNEKPDGLMICGDVYDRSNPRAEAVTVLNDFLEEAEKTCPILLISGNHDSGERLSFASNFLRKQNLYMEGGFNGSLKPITIKDINIYLLPYIYPASVEYTLKENNKDYDLHLTTTKDAIEEILKTKIKGEGKYDVLMAHLFVSSSDKETLTSDSEVVVGTIDKVDVSYFKDFDYVALGHLHRPQNIGSEKVRYAGSPLAYSFSEDHEKSLTIIEFDEGINIKTIPLTKGHKMKTVEGYLEDILNNEYKNKDDFVQVKLLDKTLQIDAKSRLLNIFPNLIGGIQYPNYERSVIEGSAINIQGKNDEELLKDFWKYKKQEEISEEYKKILLEILETKEEQ